MSRFILTAATTFCLTATVIGQTITFNNQKPTDIPMGAAVRLLPDGKQMYWVDRVETEGGERKYAYFIANVDGSNKRKLFDSAIGMDDIFAFSMVNGCVSPSGKKLAVMTTHNGKPWRGGRDEEADNKPIVVIVDQQGKELKRLPTEFGVITSPLFLDENTVVFCDNTNPDRGGRDNMQTKLQQIDLTTGKIKTLKHFESTFVTCLQLSPNHKRIAGISAQFTNRDSMRAFVYDLKDGQYTEVDAGQPDDSYYDGGPWFVWTGDSKHVLTISRLQANANPMPGNPPYSRERRLVRISPDEPAGKRVTVLAVDASAAPKPAATDKALTDAEKKEAAKLIDQLGAIDFEARETAQQKLIDMGRPVLEKIEAAQNSDDAEVALRAEQIAATIKGKPLPGQERPPRRRIAMAATLNDQFVSVVENDKTKPAYAVEVATGKVTTYAPPVLVIDRVGNTVLIADRDSDKVLSAQVVIKP